MNKSLPTKPGVMNIQKQKVRSLYKWLAKVTGVSACWIEGTDKDNHPVWGIIKRITGNRFLVRSRRLVVASLLGASLTMPGPGLKAQSVDTVSVSDFRGVNGFSIARNSSSSGGRIGGDGLGFGDINGDGYNDFLIGRPNNSQVYVVFGGSDGFDSSFNLSSLDGDNGFILKGNFGDQFGVSVASGDINGDGIDDLLIGARTGSVGIDNEGEVYVVFGHTDGFGSSMDVSLLVDGINGFVMVGEPGTYDYTGSALSSGDINGDGIDDVIAGAPLNGQNNPGLVYVTFGQTDAFADTLQLVTLDPGTSGFKIAGLPVTDDQGYFGQALGVGDINGDGIDDVLAGAPYFSYYDGSAAVIFGQTATFADTVQVSELDGSDGFQLGGTIYSNRMGASVSSGDINGDGYDDFIVGAVGYTRAYDFSGEVMVVFGGTSFPSVIDDTSLDGTNGFFFKGTAYEYNGYSVSSADLDGDGLDEVITGSNEIANDGGVYVIFGFDDPSVSEFELSSLDGDNGFTLTHGQEGYGLGNTVIAADIDGDGVDEIISGAPYSGGQSNGAVYVFFNTMNQTITGNEGFRLLSAPTNGPVFDELLNPFFTQGFTGSDAPSGSDNAWTWDTDTQAWTALSNQSTDNLDAGQGFLFYIFSDDSADGTPDGFPKRISLSQFGGDGALNGGTVDAVSGLGDGDFFLAGNPFGFTIDWDSTAVSKTNLSNTIYIYDDAASGWKAWNGITGEANEGEIAPFQGFFIQGFGGTGSLSIGEGAISDSAGVFLKQIPAEPKIMKIQAEAGDFTTNAWLSFQQGGQLERDAYDGLALQPLTSSWLRLATIANSKEELQINALPVDHAEELRIPLELSGSLNTETAELSFEGLEAFEGWIVAIHDLQDKLVHELTGDASITLDVQKVHAKQIEQPNLPVPAAVKAKTEDGHRFELVFIPGTSVSTEPVRNVPTVTELQQNYPNPFNPATTIEYGVPNAGPVALEIFDVMGRKVATLVDGEQQSAGRYVVRFDASRLASGMYLYRLIAGNTVLTKKLTLIK